MKFIVVGALFLPFALAYNSLFAGVDPICAPCLNKVVADGPSNTHSEEFANYLCIGQGGSAVAVCIAECGTATSESDGPFDIGQAGARVDIIMGIAFDYWYVYALIEA